MCRSASMGPTIRSGEVLGGYFAVASGVNLRPGPSEQAYGCVAKY
jgi:hypothetical protein